MHLHGACPRNAVPGALIESPGQLTAVPACTPVTPATRSGAAPACLRQPSATVTAQPSQSLPQPTRAAPVRSFAVSKEPAVMPSNKRAATRQAAARPTGA